MQEGLMTFQDSGSSTRTQAESLGGRGQEELSALTSTSASVRSGESPLPRFEASHDGCERRPWHSAWETPYRAAATPPPSPPAPAAANSASGAATAAGGTPEHAESEIGVPETGAPQCVSPPHRRLGDLRVPRASEEDKRHAQQQCKLQEMLLVSPVLPLGDSDSEDRWPLRLARVPSVEMLQQLRGAAKRNQSPIKPLSPAAANSDAPAENVAAIEATAPELTTAANGGDEARSVVAPQKTSGSSTRTNDTCEDCDVSDESSSHSSSRSSSNTSRHGKPQRPSKFPYIPDIPCTFLSSIKFRASKSVSPSGICVRRGSPEGATARTEAASAASAVNAGAKRMFTGDDVRIDAQPLADRGPNSACGHCLIAHRDSDSRVIDRNTEDQRRGGSVPFLEEASAELFATANRPQEKTAVSTVIADEMLPPASTGLDLHGAFQQKEHNGTQRQNELRCMLQQHPDGRCETVQKQGQNQPQQETHVQQPQKPRDFVRRLALGLLMKHRSHGKERTAWLRRKSSSRSNQSETPQQTQLQNRKDEKQEHQQQHQQQEQDDIEWESCCLLQPADEKKDRGAALNSSSSGMEWGGSRRAPSRLQRMAFSMGCFGEAAQRRMEIQRENSPSLTPSQYKARRKQQEVPPDDGSLFPRGLANLKNTCFLNAALQALAGIPCFVASLQAGLPPEPGFSGTHWKSSRECDKLPGEDDGAVIAAAAAACSSTTASPQSEEAQGQQPQELEQHHGRSQTLQQWESLQRQRPHYQHLLRQLRLQQQRRSKHQPECLGSLDENQRRFLLREFFTLLCRLTCCPSIRPLASADQPTEGLAAQRPRESNSAATCKPEQHQQLQQVVSVQPGTIRPERFRKALVAPLAGLLLNDCNMQQQQDCHEFLRSLIDLIHEILKSCRLQREEAAAAEQLLQLQAGSHGDALEPSVLMTSGPVRSPPTVADGKQRNLMGYETKSGDMSPEKVANGASFCKRLQEPCSRPSSLCSPSFTGEAGESGDPGEAVRDGMKNAELAEKKWREYLKEQESPMADFFAGQLCSEIQCAWCKRSLFIFEPAWDLSLPLPLIAQRVSLNDLLEDFFGAEELDFSCSSCHTAACKIKRFSASGQKRRTRVEFPLDELVMKTKGGSATFRLIAVIEHNGSSCQSGHYVAYVRRKRFMLPVGLSSAAGAASGRPETPRSSACSPSEFLKRIGLLRSFTSFACPSLRHPTCPTLAHASGSSPRGVAHESPFRQLRSVISEGDEDGTEWFRFDDGLVLPVSDGEVLSAEAYCLFYSRINGAERQCSSEHRDSPASKLRFH